MEKSNKQISIDSGSNKEVIKVHDMVKIKIYEEKILHKETEYWKKTKHKL